MADDHRRSAPAKEIDHTIMKMKFKIIFGSDTRNLDVGPRGAHGVEDLLGCDHLGHTDAAS